MRIENRVLLAIPLAVTLALAASEQAPLDPKLEIEIVAQGLDRPVALAFVGPDEMLVAQKDDGRVVHVRNGAVVGTALDLTVENAGEQGLLSVVTHPDFVNNALVYVHYSAGPGPQDSTGLTALGNRTVRYRWTGDALVEPELLLDLPVSTVHLGGVLAFGPDDMLYLIVGDNAHGASGKLHNEATGHEACDAGVVLRVTPEGGIPPDNPFFDASDPGSPLGRYFAYGIRNSFGIGFDPVSGELWQTEAGPQSYDELNRVERGMNGGWSKILGFEAFDPEGLEDLWMAAGAVYRDPVFAWFDNTTPTAVAFIESPKLGCDYQNDLVIGAYTCRVVYRFELDPSRRTVILDSPELADRIADNTASLCEGEQAEILFALGPQWNSDSSTDIDTGPDGLLYLASYSHGTVYRIQPKPGAFPDQDGDQVDDACDCAPADGAAYGLPLQVPRVRVAGKASTTLGWNAQGAAAGPGTRYAVVTGTLSSLRDDAAFTQACTLADDLGIPAASDDRTPTPGDGFYYLARAANACGSGTFGDGTPSPDPRDAIDSALPSICSAEP